jgi:hypothetical protein
MRTLRVSLFVVSFLMAPPQQPSAAGLFRIDRSEKNPAPGLQEVVTAWSRQFVSLGPALVIDHVEIHGHNNANNPYDVVVSFSSGALCGSAILRLDGVLFGSGGLIDGASYCKQSFRLNRAQTARAEAIFKVTRKDRHEIGEKLIATFSVSPKFELVLRIENPPVAPAVRWTRYGSGRRDDQFSMRVTRDGKPLATMDPPPSIVSIISSVGLLRPGESVELRAPISSWGDISRPGHYVVQGAFSTELFEAGTESPAGLGHSDQWDRRFQGTVTFVR